MKYRNWLWILIALLPLNGMAQEAEDSAEQSSAESTAESESGSGEEADPASVIKGPLVYTPRPRGSAKSRVGAGTRGERADVGLLLVLAPDHVGLTLHTQPLLYWYIDQPSETRIDVTFIDDTTPEPLIEFSLEPPVAAGFHALNLAEHGTRLATDRVYQWFVAYVPNSERRSNDVIASGAIERIPASGIDRNDPATLAAAGIWYDTIMLVQDQMRSEASRGSAEAALMSLAEQVDLEFSIAH